MTKSRSERTAVVIGAGAIGLAVARLLAEKGFETIILEAGPRIAEGVTSRNSGVIHSPLNYAPGTLKGRLCARGRDLLYDWCSRKSVPHKRTGKLIVAAADAEEEQLIKLQRNAVANGATEIQLISGAELKRMEPSVSGTAALFSPRTGIVDPYELSRSFLLDAEKRGATLAKGARVTAAHAKNQGYELETSSGPIECDLVINSAGLYADEVARMVGLNQYTVYPWRGDYFKFRPGTHRFEHLVYPVKMPADPGLGVHLTIDLQGSYRLGPDVELVSHKDDFSAREEKRDVFLQAARKLFPWAIAEMLSYDTCGIRPKLRGPSDKSEKDFVISEDLPGWINLMGIESPGLTASMAIAENVAELLGA